MVQQTLDLCISVRTGGIISDDASSSVLPTTLVIRKSCCPPQTSYPTDFISLANSLRNIALHLDSAAKDASRS